MSTEDREGPPSPRPAGAAPRPHQQWVTDMVKPIDCEPLFFTFTLSLLSRGRLRVRLEEPLEPLV